MFLICIYNIILKDNLIFLLNNIIYLIILFFKIISFLLQDNKYIYTFIFYIFIKDFPIEQNKKNKVVQNDDKVFVENDNNSIKIYIEARPNSKSDMVKISMEELILNDKIGVEKVEYAFSDLIFEITDVKYHEKNGQIKEITFTSKE